MRVVGRAVGSLGNYDALRRALIYRVAGRRLIYKFPLGTRLGALEGMAYLPADEDPAGRLSRFLRTFPSPEMKRGVAEALMQAARLKLERER